MTAYITHLYDHLLFNNIFKRANSLIRPDNPDHSEAECIYKIITRSCLHSEKEYRKRRSDWWHIQLDCLNVDKSVLCQYRSCLQRKLSVSCLLKWAGELNIPIPSSDHLSKEITALSNAIASMCTESQKSRQAFLLQQVNVSKDILQQKKTNIIRQILKTEEHMEAYKILKVVQGKVQQTNSISNLQVPTSWPTRETHDPDNYELEDPKKATDWQTVVCPQEIQFLLRLQNQKHFR